MDIMKFRCLPYSLRAIQASLFVRVGNASNVSSVSLVNGRVRSQGRQVADISPVRVLGSVRGLRRVRARRASNCENAWGQKCRCRKSALKTRVIAAFRSSHPPKLKLSRRERFCNLPHPGRRPSPWRGVQCASAAFGKKKKANKLHSF